MSEFEGVIPALEQALTKRGYSALTPVQKAVLAPELSGADALVSAQTGSGKTVAFGLAMAPGLLDGAERFSHAASPLALVVAPTRELALQVKRELDWLYEITGASIVSCVGGMDMRTERRALERGAHIVVGTPGRLCDHIKRGSFNPAGLKAVVLDEADEMLDLGFREELETILDASPEDRRTLMFSATVPRSIATMAKRYQRDAVRIATSEEQKQHLDIEYRALTAPSYEQENAIINVLRFYEAKNALVFCATRKTVNHMTSRLNNRGFSVVALSGELSQNERTHALQAMRDGRARVCVATDVAARGIDLPNLELVIHADIPKTKETLLHRSGRTGRAGRKGVCTLIVPINARRRVDRLLDSANIEATWARPPSVEEILKRDHERVLDDPSLSEPITEDEKVFAQEILARHSPEQVAAAFLRQHSAGRTAPEELQDNPAPEQGSRDTRRERSTERLAKPREDFKGGVWFSLSVGSDQRAEPRWLLPMLCRAGDITNKEIGAIRIGANESFVEIEPGSVDGFMNSIGATGTLEKNVTVTRLDGVPDIPGPAPRKPSFRKSSDKPYSNKKPYSGSKADAYDKKVPTGKFVKKSDDGSAESRSQDKLQGKPWKNKSADKPQGKPWEKKTGDKPQGKPWKKKSADDPQDKTWEKKSGDKSQDKPQGKPWKKKSADNPQDKPWKKKSTDKPQDKPWEKKTSGKKWEKTGAKSASKPAGKKPYKSAFSDKPTGKPDAGKAGSSPLKRPKREKLKLK